MWISKYLGLILLYTGCVCSQRTYDLILEKLDKVMIDPTYLNAGTVRVTRVNRTHNVVTGDFELFQTVDEDVKATVLTYEQLGTEYKRSAGISLRDKTVCEYLNSQTLGISDFKESTNLPRKCPIPPGKYTINNFVLDPERFPRHMPGKKWRADLFIKKNDINWAHIQLYVHIDRKFVMG